MWIDSDQPFRVSWGPGWQPVGSPLMVTKVDGLKVEEIDGRPASEVYLREIGHGEEPLPLDLYPAKALRDHPMGLVQPDGSYVVRVWNIEDGRLACFSPIPLYAPVQVMRATPDDMLGASEQVVDAVLDGREPGVVLAFSCSVRVDALGERIHDEAARVQAAAAGEIPTFGLDTYGEFARTASVAGYHDASLAALAL